MKEFYLKTITYLQKKERRKSFFIGINKVCLYLFILSYLVMLTALLIQKKNALPFFLSTATVFITVTLLRDIIDRPRPFVTHQFTPLIAHDGGKSFPSRHSACALIIALATYHYYPLLGCVLGLLAIFIGISRIIMGIHYPSDVIFAYLIAILVDVMFWW